MRSSCPRRRSCPRRATCSCTSSGMRPSRSASSRPASAGSAKSKSLPVSTAGDEVVIEGTQKLRDGAPVTVHAGRRAGAGLERGAGRAVVRLSELSVRRPVFATVMSLLLVILGLLATTRLPIRELPDVESPGRLDRDRVHRRLRGRRRDQDHAGHRGPRRRARRRHEDHVAEHRRPLEHQPRVRSGSRRRCSRERRARSRRARELATCRRRPSRPRSARSTSTPSRSSS